MTLLLSLSVLAAFCVSAGYMAPRLIRRYRDRHDPAWKPTGITQRTVLGYDYQLAKAGALKAKRQTARGRSIPKPRALPKIKPQFPAVVVGLPKRKQG